MITVDAEVVIDRPIAEVFGFVTDMRNEPKWWSGVRRSDRLRGDGGVGTTYRMHARLLGFPGVWDIDVVAHDPPRTHVIVGRGLMAYTCSYDFKPGTAMRLTAQIEPGGPWGMLGPLLKPVLGAVIRHHLRRLNRVLTR